MKTTVITVGKEVLTGKTINTNLMHIASRLSQIGIDVNRSFVIDDITEEYNKILDYCDENLIIFTGGLGPTIDDITRETVLNYFKVPTYVNQDVLSKIKEYFDRTSVTMQDTNDKQALFPVNGVMLSNQLGTAPGVLFPVDDKIIVLLPGPPHELIPMFEQVIDYLQKTLDIRLFSRGFKLVGIGESTMEKNLKDFYIQHPSVNLAPYASIGEIKYVFTSDDEEKLDEAMIDFYQLFSEYIYGDLEDVLHGVVVEMLIQENLVISTAESCTGGMLASAITSISGSSAIFKEGFVTYSNEAKMKYLDVKKDTLDTFGAVSEECAIEMCTGLQENTQSDIAISITGIAGPTGGTTDKPIGLVHFGLMFKNKKIHERKVFNGNREMVRTRAVIFALNMIRKELVNAKNYY
ncbi:MAG: competence/damage-inducible protein A [Bacilli bacterium]|nr:competence/damage-inducible protein A [Bacilli bacterium]